jgi:hypothetical protein
MAPRRSILTGAINKDIFEFPGGGEFAIWSDK